MHNHLDDLCCASTARISPKRASTNPPNVLIYVQTPAVYALIDGKACKLCSVKHTYTYVYAMNVKRKGKGKIAHPSRTVYTVQFMLQDIITPKPAWGL